MKQVIPPHEIYRTHMAEAKLRILSAERMVAAAKPATGYAALDIEFCFLQVRRVIEVITFGAMLREESRYAALRGIEKSMDPRDHGDAARDWQSPKILKRLVSLSPNVLPIPLKDAKELSPGFSHFDRKEIEVNHARLIDLYKRSGGFLHAMNPIGLDFAKLVDDQRAKYVLAPLEVRRALEFLRQLLWQHAAVTLEPSAHDDPRTTASPQSAWVVSFGCNDTAEVSIVLAEAV